MWCVRVRVEQVTLAVKENGWDGNDDTEEAAQQWSFAGALLYAVTVITTIGTTIIRAGLTHKVGLVESDF